MLWQTDICTIFLIQLEQTTIEEWYLDILAHFWRSKVASFLSVGVEIIEQWFEEAVNEVVLISKLIELVLEEACVATSPVLMTGRHTHPPLFLQELEENGGREDAVSVGPGGEAVEFPAAAPGRMRLAISDRLAGISAEIEAVDTDSGRRFTVRKGDSAETLTLPWSRELQAWAVPL